MNTHRNRRYLTPLEVEELTGIKCATLAKARSWKTLKIPFIRVGRSIRYDLADVEKFMAAHRIDPTAKQEAGK